MEGATGLYDPANVSGEDRSPLHPRPLKKVGPLEKGDNGAGEQHVLRLLEWRIGPRWRFESDNSSAVEHWSVKRYVVV